MIVWSGRGFLPVLVLIATLFICVSTFPEEYADYGFVIAFFIAAIFSWFFGLKWNKKNERIVIDEASGERLKLKNNHSLFWIPMQYWGMIFAILGIVVLFQNSVISAVSCAGLLAAFTAFKVYTGKAAKKQGD